MREVKFRAKGETSWWYGCSNPQNDGVPYDVNHEVNLATFFTNLYSGILDSETLTQYIGLTDTNGVEIYEGDMVNCFLVWHGGHEETVFTVEYGKFPHRRIPGFYPFYGLLNGKEVTPLEVIGNIYENPELLET